MQIVSSSPTSVPRLPSILPQTLSSKELRGVVADPHLRWTWRLAAGLMLLERSADDEWAMDAYGLLSSATMPALRRVAVVGTSFDRTVDGLDTILEILAAEATLPAPDTEVVLTALHAIADYPEPLRRDATLDLRALLDAWVESASPVVRAKARALVAQLEPPAT